MLLIYILGFIILFIISFLLAIKIRFKFWNSQPVFHVYNIFYWLNPPGIIELEKPKINKYVNLKDINFLNYNKIPNHLIDEFINIIKHNFLYEENIKYIPDKDNIISNFDNSKDSYFSFYFKKQNDLINNNIIEKNKLIGVITSRVLNIEYDMQNLNVNYVDYLCIDKKFRNQGIAQQLIKSHDYNIRNKIPINISFFKREGTLNVGIVPLVIYRSYIFNFQYWNNKIKLHSSYKITKINKNNINLLIDFIKNNKSLFKFYCCPEIHILLQLINSDNIKIYLLIHNSNILSIYFFKDSCTFYNQRKAIECFASINISKENKLFLLGFSNILSYLKENFHYLIIENISHNFKIIENILLKHSPYIVSPCAYYFYNFAIKALKEKDVLILS